MRILVMQQKMIGDVLTSSLLCENLRRHLPDARVHFLSHRGAAAVLQNNPAIERIHAYAARAPWRERLRLAGELRASGFDVVIDVYGKWESLLMTAAIRARRSIGYRKWYSAAFYTDPVTRVAKSSAGLPLAIEHRLQLLAPVLGDVDRAALVTRPRLHVAPDERDAAAALLDRHGIDRGQPLLMIGALGSEPRKSYPLAAMARLLDRVVDRTGARLLFNYLPSQRADAQALFDRCAERTRAHIALDLYAGGLREFIALLAQCDALIGNEGGAVNMARALDIPSFSIFSPWIPRAVWDINDDGHHPAVHLADFAPQLVAGRSTADLKRDVDALYAAFRPVDIEPVLDRFVDALGKPATP